MKQEVKEGNGCALFDSREMIDEMIDASGHLKSKP